LTNQNLNSNEDFMDLDSLSQINKTLSAIDDLNDLDIIDSDYENE
jgi:hypothetical protein